jgi:hypothetical protein
MGHDVLDYTISKGIFSIATYTNGVKGSYEDMGNCPTAEIEPVIERLPHYSSRTGYKTKDKNPVILTEYMLRFDLDEISAPNLTRFLLATRAAGTGVIKAMVAIDSEFAVKLVEDNPSGKNKTWEFHRMTLKPAGAMALITEEWAAMSYEGEGLSDTIGNPTSPYITVTYADLTGISASLSRSPSASLSPSASASPST